MWQRRVHTVRLQKQVVERKPVNEFVESVCEKLEALVL